MTRRLWPLLWALVAFMVLADAPAPAKTSSSADWLVELEDDAPSWLTFMFGPHPSEVLEDGSVKPTTNALIKAPFAPHHLEFWDYVQRIERGRTVRIAGRIRDAFIAIWPRGHAKTTSMEMAVAYLIAKRARSFIVIISGSQNQANERVENISALLQSRPFRDLYPSAATRYVSDAGSRGKWNQRELRTASGVTVRAFGMDSAMRGAKIENDRPDLIVLDDIDEEFDSAYVTGQKENRITKAILPMGSEDLVVFGAQNLILKDGIFDRLRGNASYLANRIVSGPHPALEGFTWEAYEDEDDGRTRYRITGGTPTWAGQNLEACQAELNQIGIEAFRIELQHEVEVQGTLVYGQFSEARHGWQRARVDRTALSLNDGHGGSRIVGELPQDGPYGYVLPPFDSFVGGIDYASEGESGHPSALILGGYVEAFDLIVWLMAWEQGGPGSSEAQERKMAEWEELVGNVGIRWCGGGDQYRYNSALRRMGFNVIDASTSIGSAEERRRWVGQRLGFKSEEYGPKGPPRPRMMYLPAFCKVWAAEMQKYKRKPQKSDEDDGKRDVVKLGDDVVDAGLYGTEEVERRGARRPDSIPTEN